MYKTYAIVDDTGVVEYPVDPSATHKLPPFWLGGELDGRQYVFCHNEEPAHSHEESLVEIRPVKNPDNGLWYRRYEVVRATDEEILRRTTAQIELCENSIAACHAAADDALGKQLSGEQIAQWQKYKLDVDAVREQPTFPWDLAWPVRPDVETVKIEVTRV